MLGITELHGSTAHRQGVGERSLASGRTDDPPVEIQHAGPEGLIAAREQSAHGERGAAVVGIGIGEREDPVAGLCERSTVAGKDAGEGGVSHGVEGVLASREGRIAREQQGREVLGITELHGSTTH